MGGGTKKKTLTDFKVIKKKVGKKAKPANETSTKFQAKQIVLREQSVVSNSASAESSVNARGLTVDQLLCQTRHHNVRVRREAFLQLGEMARSKFDASPAVRKSFALCVEGLTESGMRDLEGEVRGAFLSMFETLLVTCRLPLTLIHSTTLVNLIFVCLTDREGLDRRLDAARVVDLLLSSHAIQIPPEAVAKLIPCYADLCRSVLGTNSSRLARREPAVVAGIRKAPVGKILENMKREEKLNKKVKRGKAKESAIVSSENSAMLQRLAVVSQSTLRLCGLLPEVDFKDVLHPFLLAVLEVFRHSSAVLSEGDAATVASAEAVARIVSHCAAVMPTGLVEDVRVAFSQSRRFEVKRAELACCAAVHSAQWLAECVEWFTTSREAQHDCSVTEVLLTSASCTEEQRCAILSSFSSLLIRALQQGEACPEVLWRLTLARRLLPLVSGEVRLSWVGELPRAIWTMWEDEGVLLLCLDVLRHSALLEQGGESWEAVGRLLSPFFAATSTRATQEVILGPFLRVSSAVRREVLGVVRLLPLKQLPSVLLRSFCQVLAQVETGEEDGSWMVETVFGFINDGGEEGLLSFALTAALRSRFTSLVCAHLTSLWRTTRLPLVALLSPSLTGVENKDAAWAELSACVLCCSLGDEEDGHGELKSALCAALGDWRCQSPQVFASLRGKVSSMEICRGEARKVALWIEFVLRAGQLVDGTWWGWDGAGAELQSEARRLADTDRLVASNLKLVLAAAS